MTKQQAKQEMHAGKRVTHRFFQPDEYVMMDGTLDGETYITEDGCRISQEDFWTLRTDESWEKDWELYKEKQADANTSIF